MLFFLLALSALADGPPLPERNTFNFKVYPLPLAIRVLAVDIDIGTWKSVSLGPTLAAFRVHDARQVLDLSAGWGGVRANFFLNGTRFTSGFFVGPSLAGLQAKLTATVQSAGLSAEGTATIRGSLAGLVGGYHWFWANGINLSLGAGVYSVKMEPQVVVTGTVTGTGQTISAPYELPKAMKGAIPWVELGFGLVF